MSRFARMAMMESKVSIVIPVYNVEKYVFESVNSVLRQTHSNLQIIIVNDGSTDTSASICDELGYADNRITVIHQKNSGLSAARNTGIDIADGDYIFFLDSDDRIDLNTIEYLLSEIVDKHCDIAMVGFRDTYAHDEELYKMDVLNDQLYLSGYDALEDTLYKRNSSMHAWGKLYIKSLFDGVKYPEGRLYEDTGTTYKLLARANRVSISSTKMVQYLKRSDSITGSKFCPGSMDAVYFAQDIYEFSQTLNKPGLVKAAQYYLFNAAIYVLDLLVGLDKNEDFRDYFYECRDIIRRLGMPIFYDRSSNLRMRTYGLLAMLNFHSLILALRTKELLKSHITKKGTN